MTDEVPRLRRRLRAMAALNAQLRARVEVLDAQLSPSAPPAPGDPIADPPPSPQPTPVGSAPRRARAAAAWEHASPLVPVATLDLVVAPDGARYVIEAGARRRVRAGLLVPALEAHLGPTRPATPEELTDLGEAAPVEVLEAPDGPPFVLLAGQRLVVRHLPMPHPVDAEVAAGLAEGPTLDLAPPLVREPAPTTWRERVERKGGVLGAAEAAGASALRRARRLV